MSHELEAEVLDFLQWLGGAESADGKYVYYEEREGKTYKEEARKLRAKIILDAASNESEGK